MSNPFALNALNAYNPASAASAVSSPYIGAGQSGQVGTGSVFGAQKTGHGVSGPSQQAQLSEVSQIGFGKKAGFENGLGGTNNPDNHKLFLYA